jgi:hypothetical protein
MTAIGALNAKAALAETRKGLAASGFAIACTSRGDRLTVSILPGPDACAECLVPKAVLASIIGNELAAHGVAVGSIDVVYPAELADE